MNIHYNKENALKDIDEAVSRYIEKKFKLPWNSIVPLLSWLKHGQPTVRSLLNDLGMPADCDLHLGYGLSPRKGKGGAAHTDLMVLSDTESLAIEAKWTEPRCEIVRDWKKGSNPHNRQDVLSGWLSLLQKQAKSQLDPDDFSDVVYQMLHRAASACESWSKTPVGLFAVQALARTRSGK